MIIYQRYYTDCLNCKGMLCKCITHVNSIQKLHDDIISAFIDASQVIPSKSKRNSKTIPGWDSSVSYKREIALFWRSIWRCMNCPIYGNVADIMRSTRAQYHYAIRRLKRNNESLHKSAMARAISDKKSRNWWSEVNKVRNKKFTFSNNIDDIQGDDNIAELFSEKYAILYNSVTYEQTVMDE